MKRVKVVHFAERERAARETHYCTTFRFSDDKSVATFASHLRICSVHVYNVERVGTCIVIVYARSISDYHVYILE